ncbi:MAG: ribonuclease R [Deltaproteobacteria bacterium]|nr:ribonuclease R [Deltaproteobacteria bacterium]
MTGSDRDQQLAGRILSLMRRQRAAMGIRRLLRSLGMPPHGRRTVRRLLENLIREGRVVALGRGRYGLPGPRDEIEGVLESGARGWGELRLGEGKAVRIHPDERGGALPGDRVRVRISSRRASRGARTGRVDEILERGSRPIVGVLHRQAKACFVLPDASRWGGPVLVAEPGQAKDGQAVVVVVDDPAPHSQARGRILRVLGEPGSLACELARLEVEHGLEAGFPAAVDAECGEIRDACPDARADLRDLPFVTIDPREARDFDDAVYLRRRESGGFELAVSIADVSAFVPAGSATDAEACRRGCSVYLPGRVVPMLPPALSELTCSLAPEQDRACLSVEMEIDADGNPAGGRVRRSLIRSAARLCYAEVQAALDGDEQSAGPAAGHSAQLEDMADCAERMIRRRRQRGQLDLDLPELEIRLDGDGQPAEIRPAARLFAHRMIEVFMIAANEAVAELLDRSAAPALFRVHPPPGQLEMLEFIERSEALGAPARFGPAPSPRELADYLGSLEGRPQSELVSMLLLRSLAQARYDAERQGHFGLASQAYLHFTSPIRRYPDLVVHRQLGALLDLAHPEGVPLESDRGLERWPLSAERVSALGPACSAAERRAVEAERDVQALYAAAFMQARIGERADGRVASACGFGLFVRLKPWGVEGLVHVASLGDDYYELDGTGTALVGKRSGRSFRVGQPVRVEVQSAELAARRVDLALVE